MRSLKNIYGLLVHNAQKNLDWLSQVQAASWTWDLAIENPVKVGIVPGWQNLPPKNTIWLKKNVPSGKPT
jgi:hypothetical protein